ncbi:PREDICTED: UDP-glycosyltransferase 74G1-like [Nelumbo nucifera]|uniref:Glycosyltransferase n=2 Tax=Nelumbo nucifera TaxID=4432 RepID=A0A822XYS3_NELNU|nr:PREDICTED: UDP-glycosyltransferase 74G1-like [Nelumbo nucifera]DAD25172.1 TPA_asm: hypothetical protein HUJ06_026636 [Nelumbo nucifera]
MENNGRDSLPTPHVLVFVGPGQGHMNPLLHFAKRLIFKGIKSTLAVTVFISKSMQSDVGSIPIETISDGFDEGGFDSAGGAEAYNERFKDVGSRTLAEVIQKYEGSEYPFTCLVYDSFFPWVLDVAKRFGLEGASFVTQSCAVFAIYYHVRQECVTIPSAEQDTVVLPGLPPLGVTEFPSFIVDKESNNSYFFSMLLGQFSNLDKVDWVFINTFHDLESEVLSTLVGLWRVKTIGPSVPSVYLNKSVDGDTDLSLRKANTDAYLGWLDTKEAGSVVFISFGSLAKLGEEQMEEVAKGLRESKRNFLWVVREKEKSKLPTKFEEDTSEYGLVVPWCSQLEVLNHRAVGCFVTHCGWNSTLEALSLGVSMVGIPQWSDQPTNAKCVESVWEVGVRAKVDIEKGIVRGEEIERCLKEVMEGVRGETIRKNTTRWKELAKKALDAGGSSDKNIEEFLDHLFKLKRS